jgi:uncharacterized protein (DUF2141 family)
MAGVLLLSALAVGLLQAGAGATPPVGAAGYGPAPTGDGNGDPICRQSSGGYSVPCPSQVGGLANTPAKPVAGKGFKVSFKSKSGGAYTVVAIRNGKTKPLENGATGTGKTTTKRVGKKLRAGRYQLRVTVESSGEAAVDKKPLKISKH